VDVVTGTFLAVFRKSYTYASLAAEDKVPTSPEVISDAPTAADFFALRDSLGAPAAPKEACDG